MARNFRIDSCMRMTKSPRTILNFAYVIGQIVLAPYYHQFGPKRFIQPQLFACLVFKEFMQLDYRKLA
ncbi:MAG: hypothetical protein KatS3mg111_4343 [Pirellulaceae bacterium]|nr:MAG: hypothetical protein KatS3mg111_4343 [Pirellulaceae bacterium]